MLGSSLAPMVPLVCTGPVAYRGQEALKRDIANLKAALQGRAYEDAFLPAVAPSGVGSNAFYPNEEEYLTARSRSASKSPMSIQACKPRPRWREVHLLRVRAMTGATPASSIDHQGL